MENDISSMPDAGAGEHKEVLTPLGDDRSEKIPIKEPLKVLKCRTISKKFGWWAAVVLIESYAKKQVCFYLWQKKNDEWRRKQKFGIHSKEDWKVMKEAVESFVSELA